MISYCHANKAQAQEIRSLLDASFDILIDEDYFQLSKSTHPEMKRMVGDADVVLLLLSPASVASKAVRFEVRCALARESQEQRRIIFAGMVEKCAPMPEWDSTRLYANLHLNFSKGFAKLKRSLLAGAAKALPKATSIPDSDALAQLVKEMIAKSGFKIAGDVDAKPYGSDASDNYLSVGLLNIDRVTNFSAFIATLGTWTCFFYIPKMALVGKNERAFAINRSSIRSQIGVSLAGYLAHAESRHLHIEQAEGLIKLFRRFPRQIDVIISSHQVGTAHLRAIDVRTLTWSGTKASAYFKSDSPYAGNAVLPIFFAPRVTNHEMLSDALRALRSALLVELRSHAAVEGRWIFLGSEPTGVGIRRMIKNAQRSKNRIGVLTKSPTISALRRKSIL
jgi:hypothetical protein